MQSTLYYLHALSPLHVGTGQDAGAIDLPIAREKATHLPFIPGTGLKGMLRAELNPKNRETGQERGYLVDWLEEADKLNYTPPEKPHWDILFGPEKVDDDNAFAGAVSFGDAHLLCLPVRSLAGTFAWATCPFILERYKRQAAACGIQSPNTNFDLKDGSDDTAEAMVCSNSLLKHNGKIILEDLDLDKKDGADKWAAHLAEVFFQDAQWREMFQQRFIILPDSILDFLAETATEVRARVKINENRVVQKGALWWEENLPAESLLFGLIAADRSRKKYEEKYIEGIDILKYLPTDTVRLQLGGNMSIGRGLVNWTRGKVKGE